MGCEVFPFQIQMIKRRDCMHEVNTANYVEQMRTYVSGYRSRYVSLRNSSMMLLVVTSQSFVEVLSLKGQVKVYINNCPSRNSLVIVQRTLLLD